MAIYYVNKNPQSQSSGEHEVHKEGCTFMPSEENRMYLGSFDNCQDAVQEAKKHYQIVDGCYYCSRECHTI